MYFLIIFIIIIVLIYLFNHFKNNKKQIHFEKPKEFVNIHNYEDVIEKILLYNKNKSTKTNLQNKNSKNIKQDINQINKQINEINNFVSNSIFSKGKK